jgi:cytochrome c peroxidase
MLVAVFAAGFASPAEDDAALLKQAQDIFRPLPADMATSNFPISKARVDLGRSLFFDPRLTVDAKMSCADCHRPSRYGTDGPPLSTGVRQRLHPRNTPTNLNSGVSIIHWRADRESLEDQVMKALTSPITSGQPDEKAVMDRLSGVTDYAPLFEAAFMGDAPAMTYQNLAKAIGAYERTSVTPSPFGAYLVAGDVNALSPKARTGLQKFINTDCVTYHNGVGVGGATLRKFGIAEDYWKATGSPVIDKGRFDVTKQDEDLCVFRAPSLRNVAMTAPYFHDGLVPGLPGAVKFMARVRLGKALSDTDAGDIVTFLESLTGKLPTNFAPPLALPRDAVTPAK